MMMTGLGYGGSADQYRHALVEREREDARLSADGDHQDDPHLRSCAAVNGYHIHATDGDIGHVEGFLVDTDSWAIRYLIVDTSNWWLGHQVLVAPQWINSISWADCKVFVDLSRQAVKDAPVYDPAVPLERDAEASVYGHYSHAGYCADHRALQPTGDASPDVRSSETHRDPDATLHLSCEPESGEDNELHIGEDPLTLFNTGENHRIS